MRKRVYIILGLVLLLLTTILTSFLELSNSSLNTLYLPHQRIQISPYSIDFYSSNSDIPILKVSPLDEYYYKANFKDHIASPANFKTRKNLKDSLLTLLANFLGKYQLRWNTFGNRSINLHYVITSDSNNKLYIQRTYTNLPPNTIAIGVVITFCEGCTLIDSSHRAYHNEGFNDITLIKQSKQLGFVPVLLSTQLLPTDVTKFSVIDPYGKQLFSISVPSNGTVYYDEKWHLLEIRGKVNQQSINLDQLINL